MRPWGPRRGGWQDRNSFRPLEGSTTRRRCAAVRDHEASQTHSSSAVEDDDPKHKLQRTEAILVLSRGSLTTRKLAALAGLADATEARTLIRQLNQLYDRQGRAFRAEEVAGGYQLLTRPQFAPYLRRLGHLPQAVRLSSPMLETLAIVAYRQPVLRADIEAVRGVQSGELLRQLMEKDLVRISGRSDELGRPYLYSTTKRFLQVFGLRNTDALPCSQWFKEQPVSVTTTGTPDNLAPVLDSPDKESDVSIAIALPQLDASPEHTDAIVLAPNAGSNVPAAPNAIIEDEEEDQWNDDDDEDDDWEDEDDDWDDDSDSDEDDDESDDDDDDWEEEEDEDDSDEVKKDDDWEEVDDEDDDLDDAEDDADEWVDDEDDDDWDDDDEEEF
ncbi:Segregation and condensation protein B [Rosistilla carotiformis]|uniref:Segregation and condensation protein B n=1 Tax=Rosistilla carotiformis TaxID=2528017 RepID=A0A518K1Y6_9BACT|nr:SMC-Scp complex subunit ScpB [Rosistilla carotiformis]QDV71828.1 Segregation and condensation protein B [Rosistilla carotiformis]